MSDQLERWSEDLQGHFRAHRQQYLLLIRQRIEEALDGLDTSAMRAIRIDALADRIRVEVWLDAEEDGWEALVGSVVAEALIADRVAWCETVVHTPGSMQRP